MKTIELLKNIEQETIHSFVEESLKEIYLESCNSSLSGWHYDVYYDVDKEVLEVDGPMSCGTYFSGYRTGELVAICSLNASINPFESCNVMEFTDIKEEHRQDFINSLNLQFNLYDDEQLKTFDEACEFFDIECLDIDNYFSENYPEQYEEACKESIDNDWINYYRDSYIEKIEYGLDDVIRYLKHEENEI